MSEKREIKFRAWHKVRKEWLHTTDQACNILGEMILLGGWCKVPIEELNDVAVMQYTGIKDSNGVEIYEGDVVYASSVYGGAHTPMNFRGRVMWQGFRGCWAVGLDHWNNDLWKYVQNGGRCEVIGNIYEHPELLGGRYDER